MDTRKLCYVSNCIFCHRNYKYFYTRITSRDKQSKSSTKYRKLSLKDYTGIRGLNGLYKFQRKELHRGIKVLRTRIINDFNVYYKIRAIRFSV